MDVTRLNNACSHAFKKAYENYKHNIDNAIFDIDRDLIELHLQDIQVEAGKDILNWYIGNHNFAPKQYEYIQKVKKHYIDKIKPQALQYALKSL